jgi:hypothetical protein
VGGRCVGVEEVYELFCYPYLRTNILPGRGRNVDVALRFRPMRRGSLSDELSSLARASMSKNWRTAA